MILSCHCSSGYQDEKVGRGQRYHNQTKQNKPLSDRGWRCTVCGTEKFFTPKAKQAPASSAG